jgi:hypothetical protein
MGAGGKTVLKLQRRNANKKDRQRLSTDNSVDIYCPEMANNFILRKRDGT